MSFIWIFFLTTTTILFMSTRSAEVAKTLPIDDLLTTETAAHQINSTASATKVAQIVAQTSTTPTLANTALGPKRQKGVWQQAKFLFPDVLENAVNMTIEEQCRTHQNESELIGNEECAERLISDLERKFPTYGFVVGLFTAPPIKLCHSKTNFEAYNAGSGGYYGYCNCNCREAVTTSCTGTDMKSTAAIWGFGANTVVGRFQPSKNVISENNVNSKGFFVYMVKREQSYRKISEANVEFLSSLLDCSSNLSDGLKSFQNGGGLFGKHHPSPFGLIALVRSGNDLQILTSQPLSDDNRFWMGSILCDVSLEQQLSADGDDGSTKGFHVVLGAGISEQLKKQNIIYQ